MRSALVRGLRTSLRRPGLVFLLWQVNAIFGGIFAGLAIFGLAGALDRSWLTRSLLRELDFPALLAAGLRAVPALELFGATAAVLGAMYAVAWVGLHAAIVFSVCETGDAGVGESLQGGARLAGPFFRLLCIGVPATVAATGGVLLVARAAVGLARARAWEVLRDAAIAGGAPGALVVFWFFAAVHDHARIRAAVAEEGAWRSYWWALRFVALGRRRAYLLAALLQGMGLALFAIWALVAARISTDWMPGVVACLVWGQISMAMRMLLRVWAFAAQAELQVQGEPWRLVGAPG